MAGYRIIAGPFTSNGTILTGTEVELYHYTSQGATDKDVYTDRALTTPAAQPLTADSHGLITFFADGGELYKFVVKTETGATLGTFDETTIGYGLPATVINPTTATTGQTVVYGGSATGWVSQNETVWQEPLINGGMSIAQRGTSFAAVADAAYTLDRWRYGKSGTMVHTITQATDAPTLAQIGCYLTDSYKADVTTADTSIAAGDYCVISQRIRGYDARPLLSQAFVLSFWVKAAKTGTHCVSVANSGGDRCFVSEYTITNANTWEQKTVAVSAFDITGGGTWNTTTGVGLDVRFCLTTGSTFQTATVDSWQSGNYYGTANQVNETDDTANNFFLTGVQLDLGTVVKPFRHHPFDADRMRCLGAYQKSYDYATVPGASSTTVSQHVLRANSTTHLEPLTWYVPMWDVPTVTLYSSSTGTAAKWYDDTAAGDLTVAAGSQGSRGCHVAVTSSVDGNQMSGHWTAEAEL